MRKGHRRRKIVMSLVERGGAVRSFHIAKVTAKTLRPIIVQVASRKSHFMTDEGQWYVRVGEEFASSLARRICPRRCLHKYS
ncbi:MAG: transposase [Rhodoplanes sp.]